MTDSPERIWIEAGDDCPYFYGEDELHEAGSPVTGYIRADLVDAKDAEIDRLWGDLKQSHRDYMDLQIRHDAHFLLGSTQNSGPMPPGRRSTGCGMRSRE